MKPSCDPRSRHPRRGSFLLEIAAGGAVLAVAFLLILRLVAWVALDRRDADRRQAALSAAANQLERLAAQPPDTWTTHKEPLARSEPELARLLPGASVSISASDADPPGLKRLQVEILWTGALTPVRLSAYLSTRREPSP